MLRLTLRVGDSNHLPFEMKTEPETTALISATLELEFGRPGHPQIGLLDAVAVAADIPSAQAAFSNLLQRYVVSATTASARILLVGAGLEDLSRALTAAGLDVVWVRQALLDCAVEPLAPPFDCIVLGGSFRYPEQLPLLSRCREWLKDAGSLLLYGEFLLDDSAIEYSPLANVSSLQQLAERLGYQLVANEDLSLPALYSAQQFYRLLDKHGARLSADGLLDDSLLDSFERMEQELRTGRRCYRLQYWRRPALQGNPALGEYALADYGDITSFAIDEIVTLFEQSFEKAFDADLWSWKYVAGAGKCVVARIEPRGDIVAHYGGAPRKILYFAEPALAIQVCDVMVLPEKRRHYGKSSLFFKVAATFLEREIGNTVQHLLGFGFPNQKAMNIATRLGLYEKTDDFVEVAFGAVAPGALTVTCIDLDLGEAAHRGHVDRLWRQMAPAYAGGIIGVRDSSYIAYRYYDHPFAARGLYRRLLVQTAAGDVIACVILKQHGDALLLMDLICPTPQMPALLVALNDALRTSDPALGLRLWLTRGWLEAVRVEGAIVNDLGIEIPCNSWNPGPGAATLYGKWWLTAGDMDFM